MASTSNDSGEDELLGYLRNHKIPRYLHPDDEMEVDANPSSSEERDSSEFRTQSSIFKFKQTGREAARKKNPLPPELTEVLVPHVFFPRKFPDDTCLAQDTVDLGLLRKFQDDTCLAQDTVDLGLLRNLAYSFIKSTGTTYKPLFASITNMLSKSIEAQEYLFKSKHTKLSEIIKKIGRNSMFLYLRHQNAGVIISKQPVNEKIDDADIEAECTSSDSTAQMEIKKRLQKLKIRRNEEETKATVALPPTYVVLSSFQASVPRGTVVEATGPLCLIVPQQSVTIPFSGFLHSETIAEQLCILNSESFKYATEKGEKAKNSYDVSDPRNSSPVVVKEWLTSLLSSPGSSESPDFPRIQKKFKDNVVKHSSTTPLRRSGMWFTAKVALHLGFVLEFDSVVGTPCYKTSILLAMNNILKNFLQEKGMLKGQDTLMQILAKMARRIMKIKQTLVNVKETNEVAYNWISGALESIKITMRHAKESIDREWDEFCSEEKNKVLTFRISDIQQKKDTIHPTEEIEKYIMLTGQELRPVLPQNARGLVNQASHTLKLDSHGIPESPELSCDFSSSIISLQKLWTIEKYIRNQILASEDACISMRRFIIDYANAVMGVYEHDPLGTSRMLLTILKCLYELDRFTVGKYPMLESHKSGMEFSVFEHLLLPLREDMKLAQEVERYFLNRDAAATHGSFVDDVSRNMITDDNIGVKYATQCPAMKLALREILEKAERDIETKKTDVEDAKKKYKILKQEHDPLTCKQEYKEIIKYNRHTDKHYSVFEWIHDWSECKKCPLKSQMDALEKSISRYERPLPNSPILQRAVIFDIMIPPAMACLRDCMTMWRSRIIKDIELEQTGRYEWREYYPLQKYNSSKSTLVVLKSSSAASLQLPEFRNNPSILTSNVDSSYILNNGYNIVMTAPCTITDTKFSYKDRTIFKIQEGMYKSLQWTLNETSHSTNEVLARQVECHEKLSLAEFIQFGSVRAGCRIQYHNLILALRSGNPQSESVFLLVCQTLWQSCPTSSPVNQVIRDAHEQLLDQDFSLEFLCLLGKLVDSNEANWTQPYALMTLTVVTTRILEVTEVAEVINTAMALLQRIRRICYNWTSEINKLVAEQHKNKSDTSGLNIGKNLRLKSRLLDAALGIGFTFCVSLIHVTHLLQSQENLQYWLTAMTILNDEGKLELSSKHKLLSTGKSILLKTLVALGIRVEDQVISSISSNRDVLRTHVENRWKSCLPDQTLEWSLSASTYRCNAAKSVKGTLHEIVVDCIQGTFLVDSFPLGRLPETIKSDSAYQEVFQEVDFTVQPDKSGVFTTSEFNKRSYTFSIGQIGSLEIITVKEQVILEDGNSEVLELIPEKYFSICGLQFVQNFSHWYNRKTNRVLFREKKFTNPKFYDEPQYVLDLNDKTLAEVCVPPRQLISPCSVSHKVLSAPFLMVQKGDGIYVWRKPENKNTLEVELHDLSLKFSLEDDCQFLKSHEYDGYFVCPVQSVGTLAGLHNKLVLEKLPDVDSIDSLKQLIVPHGNLSVRVRENSPHQGVTVELSSLRNPKFFVYELDPFLRILRAGKNQSAWLYLAALHGATSACVPDSFTGITGTEMALNILQSPRVWSCQPYDKECEDILDTIQSFSPRRSYYPHKMNLMEEIHWPTGLPSTAAHEGYSILVEKLRSDADQLEDLYGKPDDIQRCKWTTDFTLRNKAYWAQVTYGNSLGHLQSKFLGRNTKPATTLVNYTTGLGKRTNARIFTHILSDEKSYLTKDMIGSVRRLLLQSDPLKLTSMRFSSFKLSDWLDGADIKLRNIWLPLYSLAREVKNKKATAEWTLILGSAAFNSNFTDVANLHVLQAIAMHPEMFPPPIEKDFRCPTTEFDESLLSTILKTHATPFKFNTYSSDLEGKTYDEKNRIRNAAASEHERSVGKDVSTIVDIVKHRIILSDCPFFFTKTIKYEDAKEDVEKLLCDWTMNAMLKGFVSQVERSLQSLLEGTTLLPTLPEIIPYAARSEEFSRHEDFQLHLEFPVNDNESSNNSVCYENIYCTGKFTSTEFCDCKNIHPGNLDGTECKEKNIRLIRTERDSILEYLRQQLMPEENDELVIAGLSWRLVPVELLPILLQNSIGINSDFQAAVGAMGVLMTLEQKFTRCLWYLTNKAVLEKELESLGHENWTPKKHPGWLLLEIELGMMIRPVQVKVAERMLSPQTVDESCVTQLNMGEGKTCLIVPMLAVSLATPAQLCRVTVLKSLLETNLNSLRHTLGGLVGQCVFTLPCQRDNAAIEDHAHSITQFLIQMQKERAVLVTLREHRLSIQLKTYEAAFKGSTSTNNLLSLQKWLNINTRDVLDESDELLDAKYQLVYTMGGQNPVDGGDIRWKVAQRLLHRIPQRMRQMKEEFGEEAVEIESTTATHIFPHCRILQATCFPRLIALLAQDFLDGHMTDDMPQLIAEQQKLIVTYLTNVSAENGEMSPEEHAAALIVFQDHQTHREVFLTLTGYLRYEVLLAGLTKRWKVNYGVNGKRKWNMAVPFRAKDVASERTEFSHPDMAIFLTQLSYYYSGLSDDQLTAVFNCLKERCRTVNPDSVYASWISEIPEEARDPSVTTFSSINLDNYEQTTKVLFPMLRRATKVIDFYLSSEVFPKESRVFQGKMTCTPFDLVSSSKRLPTTGFSGTNDTRNLLPPSISQKNLQELQDTDTRLEEILKRPENNSYDSLPPTGSPDLNGFSMSEFILKRLVNKKIPVLLDCGALMLELNNRAVADKWLELRSDLQGIVYFNDETNTLCVRSRGEATNKDTLLELSPFKSRLDESLGIYLDDEHTRGTDLKFPCGFKACVTVGGGLTRDKLVQACMRMRLLGKGHFVTFLASHEAHVKIIRLTSPSGPCESKDVLQWVTKNSKELEENGLIHWTSAALNFCRKISGDLVCDEIADNKKLGEMCFEEEVTQLLTMYGSLRQTDLFTNIIPILFQSLREKILKMVPTDELRMKVTDQFATMEDKVLKRCKELIPDKMHSCQTLDEEQEKEIDVEVFEETDPERPGIATPKSHSLSLEVLNVFSNGSLNDENESAYADILPLPTGLLKTQVASLHGLQMKCWGNEVFITKDFCETIEAGVRDHRDAFLRPVNFIVSLNSVKDPRKKVLLVISPYEADKTIADFRKNKLKGTLHLHLPKLLPTLHGATEDDLRPLFFNSRLCVPPLTNEQLETLPKTIPPSLQVFCGDLYFNGEEEESAFATFLGFILRQTRTPAQNEAFMHQWIAPNGFVYPPHRSVLLSPEKASQGFEENPEGLVKEIIRKRNAGCLMEESHVVRLISTGLSSFHDEPMEM